LIATTLPELGGREIAQAETDLDKGEAAGYTTIVLSFLLVFFGIRSYRDNVGNGQITFSKAFAVGISITLISCICYVVTWEVLYFNFLPGFMDKYSAYMVEKLRASGASPAAVQAQLQQLKKYKELYEKPAPQRSHDVHRALPGWPRHHADFRGGPAEKAAIATGTIALAGIPLNLFQRIRSLFLAWSLAFISRGYGDSVRFCRHPGS
jgi:Protein of unknown function (DUF4199)